ncbi:NADH:flavin oxidoreductase/NADH oxidase [Amylocystis lapponica]|nr:NADH:flavin oxidoreductase/NADH oxidase [Amylocystis lapponica]
MSTSESAPPKLFQPIKVGALTISHRVVLAPLSRRRADASHAHGDLAIEYYAQRSRTPGTLLIAEATSISPKEAGYSHAPGIYTDGQIAAWKQITNTVHANGSYIFLQIFAIGRSAEVAQLAKEDPNIPYVSSGNIALTGIPESPRPMTLSEIHDNVRAHAIAAANAVHRAGFDGVEVHGANGYLLDQFLQDTCNNRTDEYGGSIENRCRFPLEVLDAVVQAVGAERTGFRLSPFGEFQDMRMADPEPTFSYLVERLVEKHSDLAYVHVIEPRVSGAADRNVLQGESNDFIRKLWAPRPLVSAGGHTRRTALEAAERPGELVAFGRLFIANPDLPLRLREDILLNKPDRSTFYTFESPIGYIDYPFADTKDPYKSEPGAQSM